MGLTHHFAYVNYLEQARYLGFLTLDFHILKWKNQESFYQYQNKYILFKASLF